MKRYIIVMAALLCATVILGKDNRKQRETAVFYVEIECDKCVKRIQENIAFEKGLKDMLIDREKQTVTLTYDPQKTDTATLKLAFEKIRKPVSKIEVQTTMNTNKR